MNSPIRIHTFDSYYHYNLDSNYFFVGHTHSTWEINIVTRGLLEITYDDKIITLQENMLLIGEPEIFHRNRVLSSEGAELYVYQFSTDDIPCQRHTRIYHPDQHCHMLMKLIEAEAELSPEILENRSCMCIKLNYQAEKLLELLLIRLLNAEILVRHEKNPDALLYTKAIHYMKDHINDHISIAELSKACGVNPTKLKNIFSKYTGNGVINHFSDMKIDEAKRLLNEDLSISEISEILGYSSQAYFSSSFKKKVGISPIKYKLAKLE